MVQFRFFTTRTATVLLIFISFYALQDFAVLACRDHILVQRNYEDYEKDENVGVNKRDMIRGRKMIMKNVKTISKADAKQYGDSNMSRTQAHTFESGDNNIIKKCGKYGSQKEEKKSINTKCVLRLTVRPTKFSSHFVGLTPFTADYMKPQKHPPKNN